MRCSCRSDGCVPARRTRRRNFFHGTSDQRGQDLPGRITRAHPAVHAGGAALGRARTGERGRRNGGGRAGPDSGCSPCPRPARHRRCVAARPAFRGDTRSRPRSHLRYPQGANPGEPPGRRRRAPDPGGRRSSELRGGALQPLVVEKRTVRLEVRAQPATRHPGLMHRPHRRIRRRRAARGSRSRARAPAHRRCKLHDVLQGRPSTDPSVPGRGHARRVAPERLCELLLGLGMCPALRSFFSTASTRSS